MERLTLAVLTGKTWMHADCPTRLECVCIAATWGAAGVEPGAAAAGPTPPSRSFRSCGPRWAGCASPPCRRRDGQRQPLRAVGCPHSQRGAWRRGGLAPLQRQRHGPACCQSNCPPGDAAYCDRCLAGGAHCRRRGPCHSSRGGCKQQVGERKVGGTAIHTSTCCHTCCSHPRLCAAGRLDREQAASSSLQPHLRSWPAQPAPRVPQRTQSP